MKFITTVIIGIFISFYSSPSSADPGDTLWTRAYGGALNDLAMFICKAGIDADGFVVVGGTASFGNGDSDGWLLRIGSNGDTLWTRTYGGTGAEILVCVQPTSDGGFVLAGQTYSFSGNRDFYIIKTDEYGDTLWTRTWGGNGRDAFRDVKQTADNGYIAVGPSSGTFGDKDYFLARFDENGDTLWTKVYGGSGSDWPFGVELTEDDGFMVAGLTGSFGAGNYDVWLMKTDSFGDTLWTRTFGGSADDGGRWIEKGHNGGYIIAGYTKSFGAGAHDVYVIKVDEQGNLEWQRTYGGSLSDISEHICKTSDGNYAIAAYSKTISGDFYDFYYLRIDPLGDTIISRIYGGDSTDEARCLVEANNKDIIMVGRTYSYGAGEGDVYLIRVEGELELIPTLSEWGLLILILMLLAIGTMTVVIRGTNISVRKELS